MFVVRVYVTDVSKPVESAYNVLLPTYVLLEITYTHAGYLGWFRSLKSRGVFGLGLYKDENLCPCFALANTSSSHSRPTLFTCKCNASVLRIINFTYLLLSVCSLSLSGKRNAINADVYVFLQPWTRSRLWRLDARWPYFNITAISSIK